MTTNHGNHRGFHLPSQEPVFMSLADHITSVTPIGRAINASQCWLHIRITRNIFVYLFVCRIFVTGSHYISQTGLELAILLPSLPMLGLLKCIITPCPWTAFKCQSLKRFLFNFSGVGLRFCCLKTL
jgi:hypothetical protein